MIIILIGFFPVVRILYLSIHIFFLYLLIEMNSDRVFNDAILDILAKLGLLFS